VERLLDVKDLTEIYHCSVGTARNYMRQMEHMEKPLRVRESVLLAWQDERTRQPGERYETAKKRKKKPAPLFPQRTVPGDGKHIVPRKRPENAERAWEQMLSAL